MCDTQKYSNLYEDLKMLQPEDVIQLVHESKDEDEKNFYIYVSNFILQQKQKHVIEDNLF